MRAPLRSRVTVSLATAAVCLLAALPTGTAAAPARPAIVGGPTISAAAAPWQVYLRVGGTLQCGGSILDARHVLTAAHCADNDGKSPIAPPASFTVLAGFSDVSKWVPGKPPPAGTQVVGVSSLRIHPYYDPGGKIDDVMVLTLASPLILSGPNARRIGLAAPGSVVAPGTQLRVTGFGQSALTSPPDGRLRAAGVAAISDDDCRAIEPGNSAVVLCAFASNASACFGDSGGALTTVANPAQQVGIVSYVSPGGCTAGPTGYTDVTAPEVRAFLDGAAVIPRAPRQRTLAGIKWPVAPVQGSPVYCSPGAWDGSPSFAYAFLVNGIGTVQSGPLGAYIPQAKDIGRSITCVVQAANAGGVSTARGGTTPPIQPDLVPPRSRITSIRCSGRRCRLRVIAFDPNSAGAVTLRASIRYRHRATCSGRPKARAANRRCMRSVHRPQRVRRTSPGHFTVITSRLRHRRVVLAVVAYDAAGNRQHRATRRVIRSG